MITSINQLDLTKRYTYADYLTWQFDDLVELIRGKIVKMSPGPNMAHQWVSAELHFVVMQYLRKTKCKAFTAPFDVRLPSLDSPNIDTVVQPDIVVLCDLSKLDQQGCNGTPDWIIEILSKNTSKKDLTEKFSIYQDASVREYWVVHPTGETVIPYRLDEHGQYQLIRTPPFVSGEQVPVGIFPDLAIDLKQIFVRGLD